MAYMLTHFWPGATEEQYRTTFAAVQQAAGGEVPEFVHAAGPTDGGMLIVAVYDSKETSERFLHDTLMPLMPVDGGMVGPPEERNAELVNTKGLPG